MNNRDFTYLVILIIIVLSSIISQKKKINSYTQHPVFDLVMLTNIIILCKFNIYISVFVTYSYLLIKIKSVN